MTARTGAPRDRSTAIVLVLLLGLAVTLQAVRDGVAPPVADRLAVAGGAYERDGDGIVRGGIRTPLVDVPVDVLSGDPAPDGPLHCLLFGSTTPISDARLAELYADRDAYVAAYEEAVERTGTGEAPWYVVPADRKWARNALVMEILTHVLEGMNLPEPPFPEGVPAGFLEDGRGS